MDEFSHKNPFLMAEIRVLQVRLSELLLSDALEKVLEEKEDDPGESVKKEGSVGFDKPNDRDWVKPFRM